MRYYSVTEIATMLYINEETVRRWIRSGHLISIMHSKKEGNIVREVDLINFVIDKPKYRTRLERLNFVVPRDNSSYRKELELSIAKAIKERDRLNERITILHKLLEEL